MKYYELPKNKISEFTEYLARHKPLYGPVHLENDTYKFDRVESFEEIQLEHKPTVLSLKKFFMPQYETLLEYDISDGQNMNAVVEVEPAVIFGAHSCDIAGLQCLNTVFSDRPKDAHYLIRRKEILIIGFECNFKCDGFATCGLMNSYLPSGGYDMFFTELDDVYHIIVNTPEGMNIIEDSRLFTNITVKTRRQLAHLRSEKEITFSPEIDLDYTMISDLFKSTYNSPVWDEVGDRCLSCGNCTNVCPTCYCFDVNDISDLNLKTGRRVRVWDSCQNEPFAKVAGGENFRRKRSERKRHRFNRKFSYPVGRYGRYFCTGCGRCSRACMARIDMIETISELMEKGRVR